MPRWCPDFVERGRVPVGKKSRWAKTGPGKGWFTFFRIYGPQAPAFDGTWKLNDIEEKR